MAKKTITALFDSYERASEAVRRLEDVGRLPQRHQHRREQRRQPLLDDGIRTTTATTRVDDAGDGAGTGATLGTVLGGGAGLLAGLGMLAIPGVGPVVAAGWLVTTLVGAGAGAAAGGLLGSLVGAGVSEADAQVYEEGVRRGGTLVTVRADDAHVDRVVDILDDHGSVDIDERARSWRSEGWTGSTTDTTLRRADTPVGSRRGRRHRLAGTSVGLDPRDGRSAYRDRRRPPARARPAWRTTRPHGLDHDRLRPGQLGQGGRGGDPDRRGGAVASASVRSRAAGCASTATWSRRRSRSR